MGFGAEMKDFVAGFQAGSQARSRGASRKSVEQETEKNRLFDPNKDMPGDGPFGGDGAKISQTSSRTARTGDPKGYRNAIASIESAGEKDPYRARGPVLKNKNGDQALGRYQIMASNVPAWSKQVLGKELTVDQFLADDAAQDKIFDTIFGGYVDKFGERGAAQAWFGGPGSVGKDNRSDVLGTTIKGYGDKFMAALGKGGGDTGTAVAATDTAIPEPEAPKKAKAQAEPEQTDEEKGSTRLSAAAGIEMPDMPEQQLSDWREFAQLADQRAVGGPPSPAETEQAQPVMWAAEGGVIPEPDKYNASRGYTQALPTQAPTPGAPASTWAPRKVGTPTPAAAAPAAGPSTSQQAFRDMRAKQVADAAAAEQARQAAAAQVKPKTRSDADEFKYQMGVYRLQNPVERGRDDDTNWDAMERSRQAALKSFQQGKMTDADIMAYKTPWVQMNRKWLGYAEGGAVPEFADGGSVPVVDEAYWTKAVKAEGGGQEGRDRAAKRLNLQRRGVSSTAVKVRKGGEGKSGKSDTSRGSVGATEKTETTVRHTDAGAPTPTPRPSSLPGLTRPAYETQRGVPRTPPGRLSDENAAAPAAAAPAPAAPRASAPAGVLPSPEDAANNAPWLDQGFRPIQQTIDYFRGPAVPPPPAAPVAPPATEDRATREVPTLVWDGHQWVDPRQPAPAYAAGGVIPDENEQLAAPTSSAQPAPAAAAAPVARRPAAPAPAPAPAQAAAPAEPTYDDVRPTPTLLSHVREALDGGVKFLQKIFGLGGDGAIRTPEDQGSVQSGVQRFASGEGAATPEEIQGVDDKIDPDRRLSEGNRQMNRLAAMTQFYLERGNKEAAAGAAASLLQYGSQRFGRLGSLASAAYNQYQQSGDKQHLQNAVNYLEKAYQLIPDGAQVNVALNPETGMIEATRTDANGKTEDYDIDAEEIPDLLQQVQSKSAYWQQIMHLGQPQMAQSADIEGRDIRKGKRDEAGDIRKEGRALDAELAKEGRGTAAEIAKEGRQEEATKRKTLLDESLLRTRPKEPKAGANDVDMTKVGPLLAAAKAAQKALTDNDNEANQAAYNEAASRLYDASKNPGWMRDNGIDPAGLDYTAAGGAQAAAATPRQAKDGKWYVLKPNGKYAEVEPPVTQ